MHASKIFWTIRLDEKSWKPCCKPSLTYVHATYSEQIRNQYKHNTNFCNKFAVPLEAWIIKYI